MQFSGVDGKMKRRRSIKTGEKTTRNRIEESIHRQIADHLLLVLDPSVVWTSVEVSNQQGGLAGEIKQGRLNRKGVKAGWPDIQLLYQRAGELAFLALEVKSPTGRQQENQKVIEARLEAVGAFYTIVRSIDDVRDALMEYGVPHKWHEII